MSSPFPSIGPRPTPPRSYEEFWNSLQREPKYEYYYAHQLKILEDYEKIPAAQHDIAICLPTGSGKTVIGLCLSRFSQIRQKQLVLYLSPYTLLASQILEEAKGLDIPAVPLFGHWDNVEQASKDSYFSGEAIGVGTYSTLFNSDPRIGNPGLIVLDDVHAAGEFVLKNWIVTVSAREDLGLFGELVDVLREQVPRSQLAVLGPNPPLDREVEMVRARDWLMVVDSIHSILNRKASSSSWRYGWLGIREKLPNCFCFFSRTEISIRPWAPPTFELPQFFGAKRRVYLSATIDRWGNIEHIMGIDSLQRVTLPTVTIPGRRLLLNLNRLMPTLDDPQKIVRMATYTEKALVLCKSNPDREVVDSVLKSSGYRGAILGTGDIELAVRQFRNAKSAILVLANRYDGLDLGGGLCRNIVIWKLPLAIGDQEEFTTNVWHLIDAAESRARQRLQQGIGRCTRRDSDAVVIGLVNNSLAQFMLRPQVQAAMPRRLRSEFELFAKLNDPKQLDALVEACLKKSEDWKAVVAQMDSLGSVLPEETYPDEKMMQIHRREATYNRLLWTRNYPGASACAQGAAQELVQEGKDSAAAPWFYLGSVAEDLQSVEASGSPYSNEGARLLGEASSRQGGRTWFGELASYVELPKIAPVHIAQVDGIESFLKAYPVQTHKLDEALKEGLANLSQSSSDPYARGLRFLGESLGLESENPTRDAAADTLWSLSRTAVVIFEAKTEKAPDSALSVTEVRQVINLPSETEANERLHVPPNFLATCVTDSRRIAKEVKHDTNKFNVTRPKEVQEFARKWFDRINTLHKRATPGTLECRVLIQAALKQLHAAHLTLQQAIGVVPAHTVLSATE
jgi:RAD3-like DEAD/DEAH box helicase